MPSIKALLVHFEFAVWRKQNLICPTHRASFVVEPDVKVAVLSIGVVTLIPLLRVHEDVVFICRRSVSVAQHGCCGKRSSQWRQMSAMASQITVSLITCCFSQQRKHPLTILTAVLPFYVEYHDHDVIMNMMASQITSLTIVYSSVYSGKDQRKYKGPRHWPLCWEFTGDRWIPRTKGQ